MKTLDRFYTTLPDHARSQIQAIEITNVAEWFLGPSNTQEIYELFRDFPTPVPPYLLTWMEFAQPAVVLHHGRTIDMRIEGYKARMLRWACLAETHRVEQKSRHGEEAFSEIMLTLTSLLRGMTSDDIISGGPSKSIDAYFSHLRNGGTLGWLMVLTVFMDIPRKNEVIPIATVPVFLDDAGNVIDGVNVLAQPLSIYGKNMGIEGIVTALYPFMFALSLANAKNVKLKTIPISQKVARKRARNGKPSITFKILEIDNIRHESERDGVKGSARKAMHLCRGHFKTYTANAPLFGKVTGTFWVSAHVRGARENGLVVKDYVMTRKAP